MHARDPAANVMLWIGHSNDEYGLGTETAAARELGGPRTDSSTLPGYVRPPRPSGAARASAPASTRVRRRPTAPARCSPPGSAGSFLCPSRRRAGPLSFHRARAPVSRAGSPCPSQHCSGATWRAQETIRVKLGDGAEKDGARTLAVHRRLVRAGAASHDRRHRDTGAL